MGRRVFGIGVMDVVGGHQADPQVPGHADQALVYGFLGGDPMVLQL